MDDILFSWLWAWLRWVTRRSSPYCSSPPGPKNMPGLSWGSCSAFLLADGLAILVGSYIDAVVPVTTVKALSGLVFVLFGILI